MPEFTNPFIGNVARPMTHTELVRAIMLNVSAELEAVHIYLSHMDATSNTEARKVLYDVAMEELVHAGEFTSLLYRLEPMAGQKAREGFEEVEELLMSRAPVELVLTSDGAEAQEAGEGEPQPKGEEENRPPTPRGGWTVGTMKANG